MRVERDITDVDRRDRKVRNGVCVFFGLLFVTMISLFWIGGGGVVMSWGSDSLVPLLSSRFLAYLGITLVLILLMCLTARPIMHLALTQRRRDGEDGSVLVEFTMLIPIILIFGLLMLQTSLLMGGYMAVHYASYCSARAAIVQVPIDYTRDPYSGSETRNVVFGVDPAGEDMSDPDAGNKVRKILDAAVWALAPVSSAEYDGSSNKADHLRTGLEQAYSAYGKEAPEWEWLDSKFAYAEDNTWIRLAPPTDTENSVYGEHEDLHVTVRHNLCLVVPYAGMLLASLDPDGLEVADGQYAIKVETQCTLTNEGVRDWIDVEEFPD